MATKTSSTAVIHAGEHLFKISGPSASATTTGLSAITQTASPGSPTGSTRPSTSEIMDMDARVFDVLLHYIYHDSLPEFMEQATATEEATNMAQHLLVAADRYAMERLKLVCARKLSEALDVGTAGVTLDLAERHHCQELKDCCLKYMVRSDERLRAIVKTEGFMQLKQNYPLVACEILDKVAEKL